MKISNWLRIARATQEGDADIINTSTFQAQPTADEERLARMDALPARRTKERNAADAQFREAEARGDLAGTVKGQTALRRVEDNHIAGETIERLPALPLRRLGWGLRHAPFPSCELELFQLPARI